MQNKKMMESLGVRRAQTKLYFLLSIIDDVALPKVTFTKCNHMQMEFSSTALDIRIQS